MRKILTEIPAFFVIFISIVPKGLLNCQLSTFNCQLLQIPVYLYNGCYYTLFLFGKQGLQIERCLNSPFPEILPGLVGIAEDLRLQRL